MNCEKITSEYYAGWLDAPVEMLHTKGHFVVQTVQRETVQKGYSRPFAVYVLIKEDTAILSCSQKYQKDILSIKPDELPAMKEALARITGREPDHGVKYAFAPEASPKIETNARLLTSQDYANFEAFFLSVHSISGDISWLHEYFDEMIKKRYCFGVFVDNTLVSATDAPSMPFLEEKAQEIGINTLATYRQNGYAKIACTACIEELLSQGKAPLWSHGAKNHGSGMLAKSLGFQHFADVLTVC